MISFVLWKNEMNNKVFLTTSDDISGHMEPLFNNIRKRK